MAELSAHITCHFCCWYFLKRIHMFFPPWKESLGLYDVFFFFFRLFFFPIVGSSRSLSTAEYHELFGLQEASCWFTQPLRFRVHTADFRCSTLHVGMSLNSMHMYVVFQIVLALLVLRVQMFIFPDPDRTTCPR